MSASELNSMIMNGTTEYQSADFPSEQSPTYSELAEQVERLSTEVDDQRAIIAELRQELDWFKRNMFGKKTEKSKGFDDYADPNVHQMSLFDAMSEQEKPALGITGEESAESETITVDSYKRIKGERRHKRTQEELLANATQGEDRLIYASDEEKVCDWCGATMDHFGWEYVRTEVEYIPEEMVYHKVYAEKLICSRCKEEDDTFTVKRADVPAALIPHSFATASLVAFVGYDKYLMGIPGYRLEKHFERKGFFISRGGYNCRNFLGADYSAYLMTDGFTGYNRMENAKRLTCCDCYPSPFNYTRRQIYDE